MAHDGNPTVEQYGPYIGIQWQDGPVGTYGVNGAQLDDVLRACQARLEALDRRQASPENAATFAALTDARRWQAVRTAVRVAAGVEGTDGPHPTGLAWEDVSK